MIYILNVVTNAREGDSYDLVVVNTWPIIYKTDRKPDEWIRDECIKEQLGKIIHNKSIWSKAEVYIRGINPEDMSHEDWKYPVKKIFDYVKKG